jgi:hypothetical protein
MPRKMDDNSILWLAAGLGLVGILLGLRKGYIEISGDQISGGANDPGESLELGLLKIRDLYGINFAKDIERAMRIETAHFTSRQWQRGNTAGMEAVPGQNNFPYGWPSLRQFVETTGIAKPSDFYTYVMTENVTGIDKRFIHFPDPYTFILFFAWFIQNVRGGKIEYWYSLNENSAARYRQTMNTVIPRILNELT